MGNRLRDALVRKEVTLGAWIQIGHPVVAELLARAGFDWVCVDLEHGHIDLETMTGLFRGMSAFDCVPVARLPLNDPIWIHRVLDAGALGLIVPMVKTADEAERAVREAKYPPRGVRGYGFSRANLYGIEFQSRIATANEDIAVILQIEHKDAIPHLDAIARTPGVDGLFVGPMDLSGSMGVPGQLTHPDVVRALDTFKATCRQHQVSAGMHIVRPTDQSIRQGLAEGYTLLALGVDTLLLYEGATACLRAAGRGGGKG